MGMEISKVLPELFINEALFVTLIIIVLPIALGLLVAAFVTMLRVKKIPVLSQLAGLYISFTRSVPEVLQLFIVFYAMPVAFLLIGIDIKNMGATIAAVIGLTTYHSGYVAEVLRPAYLSVGEGQHEAAESLGYTPMQKFFRIILPQAIPVALPGWGNALIYLIHNSALVMYIGTMDVMANAHVIMERSYNQYQLGTYFILALFYCLLCFVAWLIVRFFEKKTEKYHLDTGIMKVQNVQRARKIQKVEKGVI